MTQISVEQGWSPLFFTDGSTAGKFYNAVVLKLVADNGQVSYLPGYNWGAGRSAGFAGGQIGLGTRTSTRGAAIGEAMRKLNSKTGKGYREEGGTGLEAVPQKLRQKVAELVGTTLTAPAPATAPTGVSVPTTPPPMPKIAEATGADYEAAVAKILTTQDLEDAMAKYQALLSNFTEHAADFHRAEAAMEMAQDYIHIRLDA